MKQILKRFIKGYSDRMLFVLFIVITYSYFNWYWDDRTMKLKSDNAMCFQVLYETIGK